MRRIYTNARLVLPDAVIGGTLVTRNGLIEAVEPGRASAPGAIDCGNDTLIPGAIDLHTDNLERQVEPRAGARWPSRSAFLAHDAQCAAAGITTVLDSLCVGDLGFEENREKTCLDGIADLDALAPTGLLKAEHFLHLRCELPAIGMPALLDRLAAHPALRLVSLMDHTPGTGQYADLPRYLAMRARDGEAEPEARRRIEFLQAQRERLRTPQRRAVLNRLRESRAAIASHDDRTEADIAENLQDGITISEFPVTEEAAAAARSAGMAIIAGAPNLVRGGSHTGNVAVAALLRAGLADALASDYVPCALVEAAFRAADIAALPLHKAIGLVTAAPARLAGLADRGQLAPGLRADFVRVRVHEGMPVIRETYRQGERVA